MKRGPRPKSAAMKAKLGTFRADRLRVAAMTEVSRVPPSWLSSLAVEEWQRVWADLEAQGRLASVDTSMLAAYCQELATYRRLTVWLEGNGHVVILPNGIAALRPEAKLADTALKNSMRLAAEFGLTPSARTRTNADIPQEAPDWRTQLGA
jgi:P27 family predicted phage terminase small subunit